MSLAIQLPGVTAAFNFQTNKMHFLHSNLIYNCVSDISIVIIGCYSFFFWQFNIQICAQFICSNSNVYLYIAMSIKSFIYYIRMTK
jgi:hypothetical protein